MINFSKMGLVIGLAVAYSAMRSAIEKKSSDKIFATNTDGGVNDCTYSDAIESIYNNTTFDSSRSELVSIVRPGGSSDYYRSIIVAVENTDFDSERVKAVKIITKNYYGF